jgi:hypothetical protein
MVIKRELENKNSERFKNKKAEYWSKMALGSK